jgi:TPR repeat protein
MNRTDRELAYIRKWRPAAMQGNCSAMSNVAAAYRILGRSRCSFKWYIRAAQNGDHDAFVDVGYCYHTGYGVKKNQQLAEMAYKKAINGTYICEYSREEAMYLLAIILLSSCKSRAKKKAITLLELANRDQDYPEAAHLLEITPFTKDVRICLCRRGLRKRLAILRCPIHKKHAG